MWVLRIGNSDIAIEHALMKKGSTVRFVWIFFISLRRMRRLVASISSENVKDGIVSASVMVFVIAFFIPVMRLTLEYTILERK